MPCTGPSPIDEKEVEKAFNDIVSLLKDKYGIYAYDCLIAIFKKNRKESLIALKSAIRDMFINQSHEDF